MLSDLFKEAIEKFQTIKINAPDVKNNLCGYRSAYVELFDKMFIILKIINKCSNINYIIKI